MGMESQPMTQIQQQPYVKIGKPSEERCRAVRYICLANARETHPHVLTQQRNYTMTMDKIFQRITDKTWPFCYEDGRPWAPGQVFIRRRLRECADAKVWNGKTPLQRISDNQYILRKAEK